MEIRTATTWVGSIKQHLLNRLMILKARTRSLGSFDETPNTLRMAAKAAYLRTSRSPDAYFFSRTTRALSGLME
jgi:hypothetical protein